MDKRSPTNLVPLDKWSLEYSTCPGGQAVGIRKYGDQIGWGPFVQGDHLFRGTICPGRQNLLGTICPRGSILWGSFVQGDRKWGTGSPGIKWVQDQMRRSPILVWPENLIWFDPITLRQTLLLLRPQLEPLSIALECSTSSRPKSCFEKNILAFTNSKSARYFF